VRDGVFLSLGQEMRLDFTLESVAATLPPTVVTAAPTSTFSPSRTGVGSTISDSLLHRLPTANRDVYDFVKLTPGVSIQSGMVSGGGVNPRFNSFVIDGANEQGLQGNNAAGAVSGGKSISIEAVKEYQVLLSPYDVRQGSFAGALVNAVTKAGTNELHGSAFGYFRNEMLARDADYLRAAPFRRTQYGLSLGGPIIRDRLHFFVVPELQQLTAPARGPFVGQSASSRTPVVVDTADIARLNQILRATYGLDGGSGGPVTTRNPLVNLFGRLDLALPEWNSRVVLRHNYGRLTDARFSRPLTTAVYPLSSYALTQEMSKHAAAVQIYSTFGNGAFNELLAGYVSNPSEWIPAVREPLLYVTVPRTTGGVAFLQAGSHPSGQGVSLQQESLELTDNVTIAIADGHRLTVGGKAELYRLRRRGDGASYGVWGFGSLDSLQRGVADSFRITKDFGATSTPVEAGQFALYASDQWQVTERLAVTLGLRVERPVLLHAPPYERTVDSLFGRRTDVVPSFGLHLSPRAGFSWDVTGDHRHQVRGGAGFFVARPPLGWFLAAFHNYGSGIGTLRCGAKPGDLGPPPPFVPDYRTPPTACANGAGFDKGPGGAVNLLAPTLRYPRVFRASLGYDRELPWGVVATAEGLYTRNVDDFLFVNLNLAGPTGVDRHGRVIYGTIDTMGRAQPRHLASRFPQVIDIRNHSRNYSFSLAGQFGKQFSDGFGATASYTYSRVRDVQMDQAVVDVSDNWRLGRALSTRHDALDTGISDYDQPHRLVLVGTYTAPWRQWKTDFSFYYLGTSGVPYTFTASGNPSTGDLNADGTGANDPVYVPRDVSDTSEMLFAGTTSDVAAQRSAFDAFIRARPCLREQRGQILSRNSCRAPWVHTTNVAIRQSLPSVRGHTLSVELQIFNALNLLNRGWGLYQEEPFTALLTHVRQTAGAVGESQPIFRFTPSTTAFSARNAESNYQMQLAGRYSF
jgi:hypothetical protein